MECRRRYACNGFDTLPWKWDCGAHQSKMCYGGVGRQIMTELHAVASG
jgi:hypothetical protein